MHHGQVLAAALGWMRAGHEVALATVVRTWGSSPRPVGSQLAVRDDGLFVGSVSGGCVEASVIQTALEVIAAGSARQMEFGVVDEDDLEVGLACGGRIEVDVTKLQEQVVARWEDLRLAQRPAWAVLERATGIWSVFTPDAAPPASLPAEVIARAHALQAPLLWGTGTSSWFVLPQLSPLRLVIIGAVHLADPLIKMADLLGYAPIIVDPRAAFANPERFPGATVVCQWPQEALPALAIDARTAIVALTHDPKIDDPALACAVQSPAFYIGALGSRKTHATRRARLLAAGHREADVARIHGPIGLPIGSRAPAEIAVSIVAQLTQRLRCGRMPRVAAVVLAAGKSTRMGGVNKLLHPFEASTMLDRVIDAASLSRAESVVVVTGHEADRVRTHLEGRRIRFVHNARYDDGMSTSIGAGIDAVADADGALILLADMPWVTHTHINTLIDAFGPHTGACICVPTYAGRRGNPVLWSREFFTPLRALLGDRGGKTVIEEHAEQVIEVTVQDDGVHRDLDTR